jgi:hypothetical protein
MNHWSLFHWRGLFAPPSPRGGGGPGVRGNRRNMTRVSSVFAPPSPRGGGGPGVRGNRRNETLVSKDPPHPTLPRAGGREKTFPLSKNMSWGHKSDDPRIVPAPSWQKSTMIDNNIKSAFECSTAWNERSKKNCLNRTAIGLPRQALRIHESVFAPPSPRRGGGPGVRGNRRNETLVSKDPPHPTLPRAGGREKSAPRAKADEVTGERSASRLHLETP